MSCPICVFLSCSQLYLVTRRDVASLLWHQSRMFPFVYVINYFANRYFASRYFASRCFASRYFASRCFASRYLASRYFANRYFASRYAASRCFAGPYRYFVAQRADISKQETAIP